MKARAAGIGSLAWVSHQIRAEGVGLEGHRQSLGASVHTGRRLCCVPEGETGKRDLGIRRTGLGSASATFRLGKCEQTF